MKLIEQLNRLEQEGVLASLYQAGVITLAAYAQREVYNTYYALLATPHYVDRPSKAAIATAEACRVGRSTVYRALRCMNAEIGPTS